MYKEYKVHYRNAVGEPGTITIRHDYDESEFRSWNTVYFNVSDAVFLVPVRAIKRLIEAYDAAENKATFTYHHPSEPIGIHSWSVNERRYFTIIVIQSWGIFEQTVAKLKFYEPAEIIDALTMIYHENMED